MTLPAARTRLHEALARLVDGRMTNDEFDELYYAEWEGSSDRAVSAIAKFGWGFYSSDLLWPYRLNGQYAVSVETRRVARRCRMFLREGAEFIWPDPPDQTARCVAGCFAMFPGIPLGIALLVVAIVVLASLPATWF